jgi:hypothetical protein
VRRQLRWLVRWRLQWRWQQKLRLLQRRLVRLRLVRRWPTRWRARVWLSRHPRRQRRTYPPTPPRRGSRMLMLWLPWLLLLLLLRLLGFPGSCLRMLLCRRRRRICITKGSAGTDPSRLAACSVVPVGQPASHVCVFGPALEKLGQPSRRPPCRHETDAALALKQGPFGRFLIFLAERSESNLSNYSYLEPAGACIAVKGLSYA